MSAPRWFRRELWVGDLGTDVEAVQRRLGQPVDAQYSQDTAAAVRGVQRRLRLPVTGGVDEATAEAIGESASAHLTPLWFTRDLHYAMGGEDVAVLRERLGLDPGNRFDRECELAVRRYQSSLRGTPTGIVTEDLSILIGE